MGGYFLGEGFRDIVALARAVVGDTPEIGSVVDGCISWEEDPANDALSHLNKGIHFYLRLAAAFPTVDWKEKKEIVDLVLEGCKRVGDTVTMKEGRELVEIAVTSREITRDCGIQYTLKRHDGSTFQHVFYD